MPKQAQPALTITLPCAQAGGIAAHRFITGTGLRVQTSGGTCIGVTTAPVSSDEAANGVAVPVDVIGTTTVECGGLITGGIGAAIKSDAQGRAIDHGGTGTLTGYALSYGLAAGNFIEVLLVQNG